MTFPAGSLSLALDRAKNTLEASTAWIAATAVSGQIVYDQVADNAGVGTLYPLAILRYASRGSNAIADGISIDLIVGGGILLLIEAKAADLPDPQDSYLAFCNLVGCVIDEMELLSGQGGDYLPFQSEMLLAPTRVRRADRTSEHDYLTAVFLLRYGDQL